ncbi:hypothetical protein NMY22_g5323 [Coprinellus aureogranulatus]|nr:hypothetical protein NMY22_g5323 [Coprinellus aureogranulatus]
MNLVDHTTLDDVSAVVDATFAMAAKHDRVIRTYGNWPSSEDRRKLVEHSGGSLIFTSTILKFILEADTDGLTPMERLPLALNINPGLDGLYRQTLSRSEHIPHFLDIVAVVVLFADARPTITQVAMFLGIHNFEVVRVLVNLHSILQVPGDDDTPVTICHTSLRDFLQDESRSLTFHLSEDLSDRICGRAVESWQDDKPTFRFITAIPLLLHSLSISELARLLDIQLHDLAGTLRQFTLDLPAGELDGDTPVGPLILRPPFRRVLQLGARSAIVMWEQQQQLAYDCLRCIAKSPELSRHSEVLYSHLHAPDHWNSFLELIPAGTRMFRRALRETIPRLQLLPTTQGILDVVLALLFTLEVDEVAAHAGISFHSLVDSVSLLAGRGNTAVKLVGSMLQSFALRNGSNSLKDIDPDIINHVRDIDIRNAGLENLSPVQLALLLMRVREDGGYVRFVDPNMLHRPYYTNRSDVAILNAIVQRAQGSPIFIFELAKFVTDVQDRNSLRGTTFEKALVEISRDCFYKRMLSYRRNSFALISIISELSEPLTVYQLSSLIGVSLEAIRLDLRSLRGIIHFPDDDFANRTVSIPDEFQAFLRDQKRVGTHPCSNSFLHYQSAMKRLHYQLAVKCLHFWFDSDRVQASVDSTVVKEYCQEHWLWHWVAGDDQEPTRPQGTHDQPTDATNMHSDAANRSLTLHPLYTRMICLLSTLSSHATVEVALRTHLGFEQGLSTIIRTLSEGDVTDLDPGIHSLGCKHDVSGVKRWPLLVCAEILLSLHRHYKPWGLSLTLDDLDEALPAESSPCEASVGDC